MRAHNILPAAFSLLALLAVRADAEVRGANGDWPQWRATPQHTAHQSMAARITRPAARRLAHLGGSISGPQILIAPPAGNCEQNIVLLATTGSLQARCLSGDQMWQRRYVAQSAIWSLVDLDANGADEFIATSIRNGIVRIDALSVATGDLLWSATAAAANVGDLAAGDVNGDGHPELVWFPAATSTVRAFTFRNGYERAELLWETEIPGYNSDPYTPSMLVIEESEPQPSVIVCGGRGETALVIIEGRSGRVASWQRYVVDPSGQRVTEGGGIGQLVALRDVDGDGRREIVTAALWPSLASYMFQGGIVARPASLASAIVRDDHPFGWEFVNGSLRSVAGDGTFDLVISRFDGARSMFVTEIIDLESLAPVATALDARILGIVETKSGAVAIVQRGNTDESVRYDRPIGALRIGATGLTRLDWEIPAGVIMRGRSVERRRPDLVNEGPTAGTIDADGDGSREFLLREPYGSGDVIRAIDPLTGVEVRRLESGTAVGFATATGTSPGSPVLIGLPGGTIAVVDASLQTAATFVVDGFHKSDAGNFHGFDTATVADVDGDGLNEIYANNAAREIVRVDAAGSPRVIWSGRDRQDPVAVNGSLLLRACNGTRNSVCSAGADGIIRWDRTFVSDEARVPLSINIGRFGAGREAGFVVATAPEHPAADDWLRKTVSNVHAVALDGRVLWRAERGPWYDATFALADFDGDGADDVVYHYQLEKGRLLSGADGREMIPLYALLPEYRDLGHVDYAGAPIIVDLFDDGVPDVITAEDGAHVSMMRADLFRREWNVIWTVEQANLDDERQQMPAAAPSGTGVILGGGTARGQFIARDAETGATLWQRTLIPLLSAYGTALTKTISLDVDGDGDSDFVTGGEDGFLHALDARTGEPVWLLDFASPLGDPIAADIDGDGFSEILVATGDGWLSVVAQSLPRRRAVAR